MDLTLFAKSIGKKMTLRFFLSLALLQIGIVLLFSCNKSDSSTDANNHSFVWTTNNKTYTATIDTAFSSSIYTLTPFHIIAGYGTFPNGFQRRIDFKLTSFNIGSYTIVPGTANVNTLQYVDDAGFNLDGKSGTLNITTNSNKLLSGNFSVILVDPAGITSTMSGSFTNTSIRP
jgi:hypothetical protein